MIASLATIQNSNEKTKLSPTSMVLCGIMSEFKSQKEEIWKMKKISVLMLILLLSFSTSR
jgi:hypothetical protein